MPDPHLPLQESDLELERWVETMPILAGIVRTGEPRCCLHGTGDGYVERETEWGALFRCGDHYTLRESDA